MQTFTVMFRDWDNHGLWTAHASFAAFAAAQSFCSAMNRDCGEFRFSVFAA